MPVTLAEAKNNAQEDYEAAVIDEFRKESALLDALIFDDVVNPAGGGATLDYGYRRLITQPTASTRAYNTEYVPQQVQTAKFTTTLVPLGGSFEVDRVLANVGPAASGAVTLNLNQKIKATRTHFQDLVINGDTAVDATQFDGLDKALTGSSTEFRNTQATDWTDLSTEALCHRALDGLDEFLSLLSGTPTLLVANAKVLAKVRAIARRMNMYTRSPLEDLVGPNGRPIVREEYGGATLVDAGEKAGTNTQIIPVETRTIGGSGVAGLTDLYAIEIGLDAFHAVTTTSGNVISVWLPDWSTANAVKKGEVELGPVGVALKATKSAAVFRNIKVQ
jgi:hypothetical protein